MEIVFFGILQLRANLKTQSVVIWGTLQGFGYFAIRSVSRGLKKKSHAGRTWIFRHWVSKDWVQAPCLIPQTCELDRCHFSIHTENRERKQLCSPWELAATHGMPHYESQSLINGSGILLLCLQNNKGHFKLAVGQFRLQIVVQQN